MDYAPIVLFTYSRPVHTRRTLEALQKNSLAAKSDLIVFSDSPKGPEHAEGVRETRRILRELTGFKSINIIERVENLGLAKSIIDGVGQVLSAHGRAIILEDDLLTNPFFLSYMNEALELYENEERVASIHAFVYPIDGLPETFFIRGADCWGWATWARAWEKFNPNGRELLSELESRQLTKIFDFYGQYPYTQMLKDQISGKNSSWAIRWLASTFLHNMVTLYPGKSLVKNIGFDQGTHIQNDIDGPMFGRLSETKVEVKRIPINNNEEAYRKFSEFFKSQRVTPFRRALRRINRFLNIKFNSTK